MISSLLPPVDSMVRIQDTKDVKISSGDHVIHSPAVKPGANQIGFAEGGCARGLWEWITAGQSKTALNGIATEYTSQPNV